MDRRLKLHAKKKEKGKEKASLLERCPYFKGCIARKNCSWEERKRSLLERCPHFRSVLREEFHGIRHVACVFVIASRVN